MIQVEIEKPQIDNYSKNNLLNRSQQNLENPKPRPDSSKALPRHLIKKGTAYEIKKAHNINYDKKIVNRFNPAKKIVIL